MRRCSTKVQRSSRATPIPDGVEDAYFVPRVSELSASLYEHCARTLDRSLEVGAHGLPLMGSGDWNDGMNRVGYPGRGESVWLGWFLCTLVGAFAPIARQRNDIDRARPLGTRGAWLARRVAYPRVGRPVVRARVLRRRHAARLQFERRMPHRSGRAGLGGVVRYRDTGPATVFDGCRRAPAGRPHKRSDPHARPAADARETGSRLHRGVSARRARERRRSIHTPACGR